MPAKRPLLLLAIGNPSRGDDALGPAFLERVEAEHAGAIAAGELASRRWRTVRAKPTMVPRLPSPSAFRRSARFISSRTYVVTCS